MLNVLFSASRRFHFKGMENIHHRNILENLIGAFLLGDKSNELTKSKA